MPPYFGRGIDRTRYDTVRYVLNDGRNVQSLDTALAFLKPVFAIAKRNANRHFVDARTAARLKSIRAKRRGRGPKRKTTFTPNSHQ